MVYTKTGQPCIRVKAAFGQLRRRKRYLLISEEIYQDLMRVKVVRFMMACGSEINTAKSLKS